MYKKKRDNLKIEKEFKNCKIVVGMCSEHFIGMSDIDLTQYNIDKYLKHLSSEFFTSIIRKNCTRDYFSLRSVLT